MSRARKWLAFLAVALTVPIPLAALAILMLAFTTGTGVSSVSIEASVYDKDTNGPVPGCLLTSRANSYKVRTDVSGRIKETPAGFYTWSGSGLLAPFDRDRDLDLDLYLGDPPYQSQAGKIRFVVRFREPLIGNREVVPKIDSPQAPAKAVVRFGTDNARRKLYRVRFSLYLDKTQIAACQAESFEEIFARGGALYKAGRYEEALKAFLETERLQPSSSSHFNVAISLDNLGRKKEALEAYRKAAKDWLGDTTLELALAESLLENGMTDEAIHHFRRATSVPKASARSFTGLAMALKQAGHCQDALPAFDEAARLCSSCFEADELKAYRACQSAQVRAGTLRQFCHSINDSEGRTCPTGALHFCSSTPIVATSSLQARAACDACFGAGACREVRADSTSTGAAWWSGASRGLEADFYFEPERVANPPGCVRHAAGSLWGGCFSVYRWAP